MEVINDNHKRNSARASNISEQASRHTTNDLSRMQPYKAKQAGQVFVSYIQAGWNPVALLALLLGRRSVL